MLSKISLSISVLLAIAVGYLLWKTSKTNLPSSDDAQVKVAEAFQGDSVKATVVAFEPYDFNVQTFCQLALSQGVRIVHVAVSSSDGEALYYPSTEINGRRWSASGSLGKPLPQPHNPTL